MLNVEKSGTSLKVRWMLILSAAGQVHYNKQQFNVQRLIMSRCLCCCAFQIAAYFPAQTLMYCVCRLSGFVWVGIHGDIRLKTARKSILLVTHSWINHSLWLWPINRQRGAEAPGWTLGEQLGETQLTGSLFITEAATVFTSSVGSSRQYQWISASG